MNDIFAFWVTYFPRIQGYFFVYADPKLALVATSFAFAAQTTKKNRRDASM
jgi:hypothetical protein